MHSQHLLASYYLCRRYVPRAESYRMDAEKTQSCAASTKPSLCPHCILYLAVIFFMYLSN